MALAGMLVTGYLTAVAWFGTVPALCAEGSGCDLIQQSRWSSLLGLPIALWGFLLYALIGGIAYRMPPRLKRWRRLWFVAFIGVAVSLYLTAVGWFSLGTFCAWCLASLAVISALLVAVFLRRPGAAPGMGWGPWLLRSAGAGAALVVALHLYQSDLLSRPEDPRLAALAIHLEASGARYYGASWCPSCRQQQRLFGAAAERLPYVECSPGGRGTPMAATCVSAGIANYPTWIIRGRRFEDVLEPEELAHLAGFDWDAHGR
ncbi:Vitamin K epoxide reductase [Thioalkalivibrio nitratireducens DSM 14787]|uniref:Vitamin K epoxide reductase n=1 Tax=Thioalkalivibrio nitratireducens (strain DSM 14787 / UNIQEM 213 / ALEN2) TaxID=1255043 RepID=L0DXB7_THIND|nr:Vitamin K epoxide reductase [Thioalkalivibrio nitratireducens DSM 14787]